jgi:uncharacterized protein YodC (DUF2158 family)
MERRVMMVLASAALVGSLLATDAQARGGGGHGGGGGGTHMGGFGGAHIGARVAGFGGARVGGIGGRYTAGIPRATVGYATGTGYRTVTGYGTGIGNRTGILRGTGLGYGTSILRRTGLGYGTGILRGRLSVLSAAAFAQTATPGAYVPAPANPAPANGAVENPAVGVPSPQTGSGPGLTLVGHDGVSTTTGGMAPAYSASAPSTTQSQAAPAFRSGNLVRLRSGGPLMTVKGIKGNQVDCFWTDGNGQINADSFPVDVLQKG